MQIIEKPDPEIQISFLENAISVWNWAVFLLHAVRVGWQGFPIFCGCKLGLKCGRVGKCPRVKWGDRANHLEADQIRGLVEKGYTNFGIHLGWSGLCVIDVDPRNGGDETIFQFRENIGYLARLPFVTTGQGGMHLYFLASKQIDPIHGFGPCPEHSFTKIDLGKGVEFLSGQHFVVAPYSIHRTGCRYTPIFGIPFPQFGEFANGLDELGNVATEIIFQQEDGEGFGHVFRGDAFESKPWLLS